MLKRLLVVSSGTKPEALVLEDGLDQACWGGSWKTTVWMSTPRTFPLFGSRDCRSVGVSIVKSGF